MAWVFGDSFDLYSVIGDALWGYWDGQIGTGFVLAPGRFSGSRAIQMTLGANNFLFKSSGSNDPVHHINFSVMQSTTPGGTSPGAGFIFYDGATPQCTVACTSGGTIILMAGNFGATLATYSGALTVANTWYSFEVEVVIHNTAGSVTIRKNGNPSNDFQATSLNTRGSANNYANKIQLSPTTGGFTSEWVDDFLWRSDPSSVPWIGDIRCYARMPLNDQSVQFTKSGTSITQSPFNSSGSANTSSSTTSLYGLFTAVASGVINSLTVQINAGFTGNLKCAIFNDAGAGAGPTTIVASATTVTNPTTGANVFTFPTSPAVVAGTNYWVGLIADGAYTNAWTASTIGTAQRCTTVAYAAFPVASPTVSGGFGANISWTITFTGNAGLVSETRQDGLATYVYDSNAGDADFYSIGPITSTPAAVFATTIRAFAQKSDAGTRTLAAQLKSGATIVASTPTVLTTSNFLWTWRTDRTDPNTGAAWTPAAVNNAQIGPKVVV